MKIIKLIALHLSDFKGTRSYMFQPNGHSATVTGANGTGKSTLMTAFLWALTGKDAQGRADYNIFPVDTDGQRISGCFPRVELTLELPSGQTTLARGLEEKWSKRVGAAKAEYKGDVTCCTVDDVPTSVTEYNRIVDELCPPKLLLALLNAAWFSEQTKDYRERRGLLLDLFGDISERELLQSIEALAPLREQMGSHTVESWRKICTERRKKLADTIDTIPARIDENRKQVATLADEAETRNHLGRINVEIAKLQYDINNGSADTLQQQNEQELRSVKSRLALLATQRHALQTASTADWRQEHADRLEKAAARKRTAQDAYHDVSSQRSVLIGKKDALERAIVQLRTDWTAENAKMANIEDTCPTCGQALPFEQVDLARSNFNVSKAEALDRIMTLAGMKKAELATAQRELEELNIKLAAAEKELSNASTQADLVASEKAPAMPTTDAIDSEEEELTAKLEQLRESIVHYQQAAQEATAEKRAEVAKLQIQADEYNRTLAQIQNNAAIRKRIADLEQEQRNALADLEEIEEALALCDTYTKIMVTQLTDRVNQHFKTVTFRLFEQQKNGGLKEICEASVDGVPYGSLNTAARMQANVEIVQAFSAACGYSFPLFLDNRESVTALELPEDLQVINLMVDAGSPTIAYTI